METNQTKTITSTTPQQVFQSFRHTYTYEEVQEELWRCIQPRLLESFKDLNPDSTNHIATFYENIEILLSALYQLPLPAASPLAEALDTLHEQVPADWVLLISPPE